MKTEYAESFIARAVEKVVKANALGSKTTWTTEDHLRCMALTLDALPDDPVRSRVDVFQDCLADVYNISAFQQYLEKKFNPEGAPTGHFLRAEKRLKSVSALDALINKQLAEATAQK